MCFHNRFYLAGTQLTYWIWEWVGQTCKLFSFTGTYPFQSYSLLLYSHLLYITLQQVKTPKAFIITFVIMTVARVATANQNTVCTFPKCRKDKGRFNPAWSHYPDYANIISILHSWCAGQVSARIWAPVTQECNYCWFKIIHSYCSNISNDLSINPLICARICSSVKCRDRIAPVGHADPQVPHPLHKISFTNETFFSSSKDMAE